MRERFLDSYIWFIGIIFKCHLWIVVVFILDKVIYCMRL